MTHPDQQSCTTLAGALVHATITVIVNELSPTGKLLGAVSLAKTLFNQSVKLAGTLGT